MNTGFEAIVGQDQAIATLMSSAVAPVHAYLFLGPPGCGKEAASRAFAGLLVADDGDERGRRLAAAGQHPDVREVERVGASILKDQAAEVIRAAALSPTEGRRKVMVLHEFHLLAPEAAAMLLKTIEEPPASTVFIVLADMITPELVTIASRCVRVDFRSLSDEVIAAALIRDGIDEATAESAARAAGGDLDRARLLAVDPDLASRRAAFGASIREAGGSGNRVVATAASLLALIDSSAAPLKARHGREIAELEERVKASGERGSGRKQVEDRHKRELRRYRVDELRAGLAVLAGAYRDALVEGSVSASDASRAMTEIHGVIESFDRNPNESLQLQALLLRLPAVRG